MSAWRWVGRDDGPPVVLVHGLGATMRSWDRVVPLLEQEFRLLLVDLPGFGERAGEARRGVTIADLAAALAGDIEAAGAGGAVVAGHSMGGVVAVALAEAAPASVGRLVLLNAPTTYEARLTARTRQEGMLRAPVIGPLLWRLANGDRLRAGLRTAFAPGFEVPDEFVTDLEATPWAGFAGATSAMDDYLSERPLAARLGALPVPTTVVFGDEDRRVDPASLATFDGVPGVEVVRLPGVGHTPIWEAPERTAEAISAPG